MDEGSVFTRLEETRAELESKLGMDVFMEAYSECQVSCDDATSWNDGKFTAAVLSCYKMKKVMISVIKQWRR